MCFLDADLHSCVPSLHLCRHFHPLNISLTNFPLSILQLEFTLSSNIISSIFKVCMCHRSLRYTVCICSNLRWLNKLASKLEPHSRWISSFCLTSGDIFSRSVSHYWWFWCAIKRFPSRPRVMDMGVLRVLEFVQSGYSTCAVTPPGLVPCTRRPSPSTTRGRRQTARSAASSAACHVRRN